jgi:hypothetical protein
VLRLAAVSAILLLAGCIASAPTASIEEPAAVPADDGMVVTATRVVPLVHAVDERGTIEAEACTTPRDGCASVLAVVWEHPQSDFGDPLALFWRVKLHADWQSKSLVTELRMTVFATKPCGVGCLDVREVATISDDASPGFDSLDVFLEPGENGLRIQLDPVGEAQTAVSEARIEYHLHGGVGGYRAASDPVVL